jgi:hypothetical protein
MADSKCKTRRQFLKGISLAGIVPLTLGTRVTPSFTTRVVAPEINGGHQEPLFPLNRPLQGSDGDVPLDPVSSVVVNNAGINFGQFRIAGDNNPNLFVLDSGSDVVAIGGTPVSGQSLTVYTQADAKKGLVIRANSATQSANLFEVQDGAGSTMLNISPIGKFVQVVTVPSTAMGVQNNAYDLTLVADAQTTPLSNPQQGLRFLVDVNGTGGNPSSFVRGINGLVRYQQTAGIFNSIIGVSGQAAHRGSGQLNYMIGINGNTAFTGTGGAVLQAVAIKAGVPYSTTSATTCATQVGIYIENQGKPFISNAYALYIEQTRDAVTANYAIYSEGGASVLKAGSPTVVPLMIQGAASQTAPLQEWRNNAGNLMAVLTAGGLLDVQGISVQLYTSSVSNPPTKAQLDSVFGNPATLGAGFIGLIDSNGAQTDVYLCVTTPTNWFYTKLTKAL